MRRSVFLTAAVLTLAIANPAAAANASFGCEARTPAVCYFRIFYYPQYNRQVVLPAGMKVTMPGVNIGRDRYCVSIGTAPLYRCASKVITADYNH
jgi:hypothetical protein